MPSGLDNLVSDSNLYNNWMSISSSASDMLSVISTVLGRISAIESNPLYAQIATITQQEYVNQLFTFCTNAFNSMPIKPEVD